MRYFFHSIQDVFNASRCHTDGTSCSGTKQRNALCSPLGTKKEPSRRVYSGICFIQCAFVLSIFCISLYFPGPKGFFHQVDHVKVNNFIILLGRSVRRKNANRRTKKSEDDRQCCAGDNNSQPRCMACYIGCVVQCGCYRSGPLVITGPPRAHTTSR